MAKRSLRKINDKLCFWQKLASCRAQLHNMDLKYYLDLENVQLLNMDLYDKHAIEEIVEL